MGYRSVRAIVFLTYCLSVSSCITYVPLISVNDPKSGDVAEMMRRLSPGSYYQFTYDDGNQVYMTVDSVQGDDVYGKNAVLKNPVTHRQEKKKVMSIYREDLVDIRRIWFGSLSDYAHATGTDISEWKKIKVDTTLQNPSSDKVYEVARSARQGEVYRIQVKRRQPAVIEITRINKGVVYGKSIKGELFMAREQDIIDMQKQTTQVATASAASGPGGGRPYAGIKIFRQVYLGYRFGKTSKSNFALEVGYQFPSGHDPITHSSGDPSYDPFLLNAAFGLRIRPSIHIQHKYNGGFGSLQLEYQAMKSPTIAYSVKTSSTLINDVFLDTYNNIGLVFTDNIVLDRRNTFFLNYSVGLNRMTIHRMYQQEGKMISGVYTVGPSDRVEDIQDILPQFSVGLLLLFETRKK